MKTTKLLLIAFVTLFSLAASCEADEQPTTERNCVKTFYLYYPAMSSGSSYVPAHYEIVNQQVGSFEGEDETNDYVPVNGGQYTHYKIQCD